VSGCACYTGLVGAKTAAGRFIVTSVVRVEDTRVMTHERIPTEAIRYMHPPGWLGFLDGQQF